MKIINKIIYSIRKQPLIYLVFLVIFLIFYVNSFHTQFPDEFDNIYGGFLINQGKLPYTGFFAHHNPGAYYLASLITVFTQRNFVAFRIVFSLLLFISFVGSYYLLKQRLKKVSLDFFLLFGLIIGLGATYWWGHMILSETIAGYCFVPVVIILIIKKLEKIKFDTKDLIIVSLLSFFALFTSLTYIYLVPIFYAISIYYYLKDNWPINANQLIKLISIFILPYLVFLLYLIITRSLSEFYFASITYNVKYYIYNFPLVGDTFSHNPARYALSIAKNTYDNFFGLLVQIKDSNFGFPFNLTLALTDMLFIIYLLSKKQYSLVLLVIGMVFYTNARSEPVNIKETDFHATVFIMLSLLLGCILLLKLKEELKRNINYFDKLLYSFIFIVLSIYWFFNTFYISQQFMHKYYDKFMGRAPLIYNRQKFDRVLNQLLTPNDYYWIGPFELNELLFIKAKQASKYYWFLPANSRDDKIKREITEDFNRNQPKIIVFKKWFSNFGVRPEEFNTTIVNFLDQNYFSIGDLNRDKLTYNVLQNGKGDFDFDNEFFFANNRKEEIINELIEKKFIEKI